ncbi:NTP transferase domain-containing protein [Aromatoleum bremense]|uniref:NTP transferase domain-containing protein n=1 Tax=Aromatoleum bremense TaxID=76115 RepID=A0ABX1NYY7_9RHOO|nr:molybdopterin-binding/glycosyltransferase family 2 protein [Aromatoleum bremense]NMG17263.1 NTP transferase domain-containing protein [Aromatoleum bremense]QTQ31329.1 Putative bifunctional molybdopterin binding protein /nucleotidyl transferase [Aromatoleum bremense]
MIFGEFDTDAAAGVMLAHTLKAGGRTLKKGRTLVDADLAWLREAGIDTVLGARLAPGDVAEDAAAAQIAALLTGPDTNAATRPPYTGRCNLHASLRGVVQVDIERIDRLNLLDEAVAIGTLPQHAVARPGQVVATVKIIPFAVPASLIEACREIASAGPLLRVAELKPHRVALIMSELPGMKESIFAGTVAATRHRLDALGSRLALVLRCAHERAALEAMVRQALASGCELVLVCGATVAKDRNDIAPAAVTAAGGRIDHFGMPVEPGNMLVLAHVGSVPVVIMPGCGRSRRTNGLDWVLQRLLAGLAPTREDIMRLGVGGLIRSPLEAEDAAGEDAEDGDSEGSAAPPPRPGAPRVAALVLAAGQSSRMGAANKLLIEVGGVPMVLRAVNAARASRAASVTVVVGHEAEAVGTALATSGATLVDNPDHAQGMSSSLRHGIAALPDDIDAVIVLLGDMPRITAEHVDRVIAAFDPAAPSIVMPEKDGRRGNPILWPREFFAAMAGICGDQGARGLIEHNADRVKRIAIDDDAIFVDVDRPGDLAQAEASLVAASGSGMVEEPVT